jgi:hypothetical protein
LGKRKSSETRRKMSEAHQIGVYETPWGYYASAVEAKQYIDATISICTIINMCRNPDRTVTRQMYSRNGFLRTIGPWCIGKTIRSLGFGFEQAKFEMISFYTFGRTVSIHAAESS